MPYDLKGAINAGLTPQQITSYLAENPDSAWFVSPGSSTPFRYNVAGALRDGHEPERIIGYLNPSVRPSLDPLAAANTPATDSQPAAPSGTPQDAATTTPAAPPVPSHSRMQVQNALGAGYSASEVVNHMAQMDGPVGDGVRTALKWNYTPEEIVDHLNPAQQSPGDRLIGLPDGSLQGIPILAPIQRGIASAQRGVANLADDVGFHDTATGIRSRVNQVAAAAPSSGADMATQLAGGHYGAALADIPSAALEQNPSGRRRSRYGRHDGRHCAYRCDGRTSWWWRRDWRADIR